MEKKKYRFNYHYFKQKGMMSVHFKKTCTVVSNIVCKVPCETKWNKIQPRLVMQGFAEKVTIKNNIAIIE
jgi:hypothetical protein